MATDEALSSQWYDALYDKDSLKVQALVAAHPSLLKVGWGNEAPLFLWRGLPWKQRTALYVGVRRGNAELVEQVLKLCKVTVPQHSTKKEDDGRRRTGQSGLAEREDAQKNEISNADPSGDSNAGEGDRQPATKCSPSANAGQSLATSEGNPAERNGSTGTIGFQNAVPSTSRSDPGEVDASREIAGPVVAHWKLGVDLTGLANVKFSFSTAVSSIRRSKRDGDEKSREIARLVVAKWKRQVDDSRFLRISKAVQPFLKGLLEFKDESSELNASATAVLHGNRKIILLLVHASQQSGRFFKALLPAMDATAESVEDRADRAKLRGATELVVRASSGEPMSHWVECLRLYRRDFDFNFLPWQEYLFHFLFCTELPTGSGMREWAVDFARVLWSAVTSCAESTWRFLLRLQDGQGRTPLSAAIHKCETLNILHIFASAEGKVREEVTDYAMGAPDGAGRTAIHVALAKGEGLSLRDLVRFWGDAKKVEKLVCQQWRHPIPAVVDAWTGDLGNFVEHLSHVHGLDASDLIFHEGEWLSTCVVEATPLQSAILRRAIVSLKTFFNPNWGLFEDEEDAPSRERQKERAKLFKDWGLGNLFRRTYTVYLRPRYGISLQYAFHGVELAAFAGDANSAAVLPMGEYNKNSKLHSSRTKSECPWPALHIAANNANYDMLKLILDDPTCDPYIEDWNGNTALHHALKAVPIIEFGIHLLDYVSPRHFKWGRPKIVGKETLDDYSLSQRKGCINLLLQVGCDIFKTNKKKQPPYPGGELSSNSEFLSWWYARQAKEFESTQSTLSSAANAISVTATLVATASYVGPLQPPMGIAGDPSQIQETNLWVRIFIFCDTMSFYLAIAAITLSLIPSIPVPQQQMKDEVQRTQFMVAMAVIILFPSIVFVLVAFIASSIAVVSANPASTGGSLTLFAASLGGLFCLLTFTLFSLRLVVFLFPKSKVIRRMYNATNWSLSF